MGIPLFIACSFALPEFSTTDGKVVNAIFGMAKFFVWQLVKEKPDYLVFIKDAKGDNFRHELYSDYKATRERMPDNLRSQIADIEEMIQKMNIDIIEIPGYEADDVIATLAEKLKRENDNEIYILSWDKDLYALVDEQVKIYDTQRKKISGPDETFEKFWVPASCVRDYLAICWDSSDNIPGIAGIWPKKAQVLLNEYGSLEKVYNAIDSLDEIFDDLKPEVQKLFKWKTLEKFVEGRELAFLSQKLATLADTVELPWFDIHDYEFIPSTLITPEVNEFFKNLEFFSLVWEDEVEKDSWEKLWKKVQIIWDDSDLKDLEKKVLAVQEIVLDTETTDLDVRKAQLVWVSLLLNTDDMYYINLMHTGPQVSHAALKEFLRNILDSDLTIIWHNLKYDLQIIEMYLKNNSPETQEKASEDFWQMSFEM